LHGRPYDCSAATRGGSAGAPTAGEAKRDCTRQYSTTTTAEEEESSPGRIVSKKMRVPPTELRFKKVTATVKVVRLSAEVKPA